MTKNGWPQPLSSWAVAAGAATLVACSGGVAHEQDGQVGQDEQKLLESSAALDSAQAVVSVQFGTRVQEDYQNNWCVTMPDTWKQATNFNNTIASISPVKFDYNLRGARVAFEDPDTCGWGCGYVDSVDFFYTMTHGGISSSESYWAMWDSNSLAYSGSMRLGASGRQNMVFATDACDTHRDDANTWTRWASIFQGGLVETLGGHHLTWSGNPQQGTEFASRMRDGEPIGQSWLEAMWYADNRNTPAIITTGGLNTTGSGDPNDCWNRQGTTVYNLLSRPILRDGAIGNICWSKWN